MLFCAVGSLNNDRSVMSKSYSWRPIALLPILKSSACTNPSSSFLRYRRLDLYHSCMDIMIDYLNRLCYKDMHIRYADNMVRLTQCFLHLLSMDGLEVSASTLCDVTQCPTCTCPHDYLDSTEDSYPLRDSVTVQESVKKAQETLLDEHKQVKDRHKKEVTNHIPMDIP